MKTCSTCRHWRTLDEWDVMFGGLRKCERVREKWRVEDEVGLNLVLDDEGIKRLAEAAFGAAKAVVNDGSSYQADLLTRPDFGCVLHEDKS